VEQASQRGFRVGRGAHPALLFSFSGKEPIAARLSPKAAAKRLGGNENRKPETQGN